MGLHRFKPAYKWDRLVIRAGRGGSGATGTREHDLGANCKADLKVVGPVNGRRTRPEVVWTAFSCQTKERVVPDFVDVFTARHIPWTVIMRVSFRLKDGRTSIMLTSDRYVIGRDPNCDIVLQEDAVSRQHAILERSGDVWRIRDLGSRNGTFLNGRPVKDSVAVSPGDTVACAKEELKLEADLRVTVEIDSTRAKSSDVQLSNREREILKLVAEGLTDVEIALQLHLSRKTVESHLDRIRDKTGCRRRPDLTRFAVKLGILP